MRNAFLATLLEQAAHDESLWLLCGDLGFSVLEPFMRAHPQRFINVGVAEQNMIGVAAGLALAGKNVFTYTIGNFAFMRCLEQIRNDVCYHNLNVTIVAVGGGFAYGSLGYTHHAVEDIAMLRTLPNLHVVAPGDPAEVITATRGLVKRNGPAYLRLGRGGEKTIHPQPPEFALGQAIVMEKGSAATILTSAGTLDIAYEAVQQLRAAGADVGLVSMPTLSPFDAHCLREVSRATRAIITIEEHGKGGLAAIVAEQLMLHGYQGAFRALYAALPPAKEAGDRNWQRQRQGLTVEKLIEMVITAIPAKTSR